VSALTPTWLFIAAACLTLAVIHAHVWLRRRDAGGNLAFALLSVSVAAIAFIELGEFQSTTTAEYGRWLWWYQVPIWSGIVAIVVFVRLYLRAGTAWLGWTAVGLRSVALVIGLFSPIGINFREIVALEKITLFGDTVAVGRGVPNPWLAVAHLALLALLLFVASATRDLWRAGERRRAVTIGGSLFGFIAAGTVLGIGYFWGWWLFPSFLTPMFLVVVLAMAYELSLDLLRTTQLAADLNSKDAALQGTERKLALAADAASAGLWSVELSTGRLWATPRALSMFGLAEEGGHHIDEVLRAVHPEDRKRVREFIDGAVRLDRGTVVEFRVQRADGEVRWIASRGGAQAGGPQRRDSLMGVAIDVTERKRAEDETARQRVQLEHLSRVATLSEMSGALAHELNQPLAVIMSNAEAAQRLLERPSPDLAEIREILGDIVDADQRAGEVIQRLRTLLKRGLPKHQPLAVNELVHGVQQFMRADLLRRGVSVECSLAAGLPLVSADRVAIEQVLINVISNACDAMAGNAPGDRGLTIATCAKAGEVEVCVSDTGAGLPAMPERVFEPFYTTKAEGLGMGLAISRSIVVAHGGRLWAEPHGDRGATFRIGLPAMAAAA
jgi:two-component system sensor kinase FixL